MAEKRLAKTWEAGAFDREKNEWVHTELRSYDHVLGPEDTFTPATPAIIRPSKRKPTEKPQRDIMVFSDMQVGYRRLDDGSLISLHDERALSVAVQLMRFVQPEVIINLGDTVDLAELSRFRPDSDHFHRTMGPAFQRVHDFYAQLRADHPHALIHEVDSNHNTRLKNYVLKYMPAVYGMRRAGDPDDAFPVMTYPYLANLRHVGVGWRGGYSADEFVYGEEYGAPPIVFRHGTEHSTNGTTASKVMKNNPETHAVQGHDHNFSRAARTNRTGQYLSYVVVPTLCRITGEVPGFHTAVDDHNQVVPYQEDWQQGVLHIEDHLDGTYSFNMIMIMNGIAHYRGRTFIGVEEERSFQS